jgi:hypothetical protein
MLPVLLSQLRLQWYRANSELYLKGSVGTLILRRWGVQKRRTHHPKFVPIREVGGLYEVDTLSKLRLGGQKSGCRTSLIGCDFLTPASSYLRSTGV